MFLDVVDVSTERQKPRVLFLTQYFPPETGAPQARIFELARNLHSAGYPIEVLTGMPNYPTGKIYSGYRYKLWKVEEFGGLRVIRTILYPSKSTAMISRLLNYFSFVLSSILIGSLLVRRPGIVVVESPPLFLGLSGMFFKRLFKAKMVFNVSDLWPESVVRLGFDRNSLAIRLATALEVRCYRSADLITGQSQGIVRGVREKQTGTPVEELPNGCDCSRFHPDTRNPELKTAWRMEDRTVVGYAGLFGMAQGVSRILELAEYLEHRQDIGFLLVGDGPERERIEQQVRERRLTNIHLLERQPREAMPEIVATMDLAIIPLRHYLPGALPSKIYEAMASGVPILLAATGDAADLTRRADCGLVVSYDDINALTGAISELADDSERRARLGSAGRVYALKHHDRKTIAEKFAGLLKFNFPGA